MTEARLTETLSSRAATVTQSRRGGPRPGFQTASRNGCEAKAGLSNLPIGICASWCTASAGCNWEVPLRAAPDRDDKTERRSQNTSLGQRSKWWLLLFVSAIVFAAAAARAQPPVIFLVRHAERAAISGHVPSDTGLSREGKARAEDLARALKDAQITAIYTTEYKRTRETAEPLAQSLGIRPEIVQSDDFRTLLAKLKAIRGNALVVGHSNTLPQIISALGISSRATVAETDHDNLFMVVLDQPPRLIHLHYR